MTVKAELLAIKETSEDGLLYADDVVEWAQANPRSELYRHFEWNDAAAGHAHRVWQARRLIKMHVVTLAGEPEVVSLTIDRTGRGGYRTVDDVIADRDLAQVMLQDALAELTRVRRTYARVLALVRIWKEIDRAEEQNRARSGKTRSRGHGQAGEERPRPER